MKTLTKQGAIERIRQIDKDTECDHLVPEALFGEEKITFATMRHCIGARQELMHIFDIKEEEL